VVLGDQAHQERGLFERIGDVVGELEQARKRLPAALLPSVVASPHHQVIGLALPHLGARRQGTRGLAGSLVVGLAIRRGHVVRETVGDGLCERVAVRGMLVDQVELATALAHAPGEQHAGFVGDERSGLTGQQRVVRLQ